jgi:hypothetical protein
MCPMDATSCDVIFLKTEFVIFPEMSLLNEIAPTFVKEKPFKKNEK